MEHPIHSPGPSLMARAPSGALRSWLWALGLLAMASCGDGDAKGANDPDASVHDALGQQDGDGGGGAGDGDQGEDFSDGDASSNGEGGPCGTRNGKACAEDEFCDFAGTAQCGALDQGGVCTRKPDSCPSEPAPVCGCDDKTYPSQCEAHAAGVSVQRTGACDGKAPPEPKICGGLASLPCDKSEFCNYEEEAGGLGCAARLLDGTGVCQPLETSCTRDLRQVCGCDGVTYPNACTAHAMGASIADFSRRTWPPSSVTCASTSSIESTST